MPKISVPENAGNSPKEQLLIDFNIAFVKNDYDFIINCLTDDIHWNMVGGNIMHGKDVAKDFLESMTESKGEELVINTVIIKENLGVCDGTMKFMDGSTIGFCDIYTFSESDGLKISSITSYGVEMK